MNKLEAARKRINIIGNEIQDRRLEIITMHGGEANGKQRRDIKQEVIIF